MDRWLRPCVAIIMNTGSGCRLRTGCEPLRIPPERWPARQRLTRGETAATGSRVNLLFVNSIRMWGGAEAWFLRVMQGLAERGHATHLACVTGTPLDVEARRRGRAVHAVPVP